MDSFAENNIRIAEPSPNRSRTRVVRNPPDSALRSPDLQALVRNHEGEIRRFVISRIGYGTDADDIAQQTLLQATRKLNSFRGNNLRPWLFTIARRLILDLHRERARFLSIDEVSLQNSERALQTSFTSVQSECEAHERIQCCMDCIRTLMPPVEQITVLLSDVYGFTDKESANRLRMSVSAFKFMLHKARARLHAAAADEQPGNECPLVNKTGVQSACPGCAHPTEGLRQGGRNVEYQRSGLDDSALAALQQELLDALDIAQVSPSGSARTVR